MNKDLFIKKVMEFGNIHDKYAAEKGVQIVFSILSHRLTEKEAQDAASQLPKDLKKMWENGVWITSYFGMSNKRLNYKHKAQLFSLIENEILREQLPLHAEDLTIAVFHVLKEQITAGEISDITAMLPDELKEFFKAA